MRNEAAQSFEVEEVRSGVRATTLLPPSRGRAAHPVLQPVIVTLVRVAAFHCAILVTAEAGAGADIVAAAIHDASPRRAGALVTLTCDAEPDMEAKLARAASRAEGGTLFLDEVAALEPHLQSQLLSLLDSPSVRVVAATDKDLEALVAAGRFRADLFYRLSAVHLALPPLRARARDLEAIAMFVLRAVAKRVGRAMVTGFSRAALDAMRAYAWPGNVRELENAVERAVLLASGANVESADLPERMRTHAKSVLSFELPCQGIDLRKAVDEYENTLIKQALARTGGNKHKAARLLGLQRTTLVEMIKRKRLA